MAWIIVIGTVFIALIAGLGTAAVYRWREDVGLLPLPVPQPPPVRQSSSAPKRISSLVAQIQPQRREDAEILFNSPDETHQCPQCSRAFNETIVLCPFDGHLLEPFTEPTVEQNGCCPDCARVFEPKAKFCHVDGRLLSRRSDSFAAAKSFHACTSCGLEWTQADGRLCDCDSAPVLISRVVTQTPTIPMSKCGECGHIGLQSQVFCPNDGHMLEPMVNIHNDVFPVTGFGPKRTICPECGESYGRSAKFCAHDGSTLILLN